MDAGAVRSRAQAAGRVGEVLRRRWGAVAGWRVLGIPGSGAVIACIGALLITLVVVVVVGFLHAERLDHRLQSATASVERAQAAAAAGDLPAATATINADEQAIVGVDRSLDESPDFRLLALLPVAHQNLDAVRSASRQALGLLDDARLLLATATNPSTGHLDLSLRGGQAPLAVIARLHTQLDQIIPTLPSSPRPPARGLLVGPVSRARTKVWSQAYQRRKELVTIDDALGVLNEITGGNGPRSYLIAVANTAEMRGAGGMILNYGVLNADGGRLSIGDFGDIDNLLLHKPAARQFPDDYQQFFGNYHSNLLWRNATIMSDFTVDAPVLQSMYQDATGRHVDGVLQIDPVGLSAILAGIGPIHDPVLGTLDAANVAPITLNLAYLEFPVRSERQSFTGNVAKEAFAALSQRPVALGALIQGLNAVTADRHIEMWSSTPGVESDIAGLGATGGLPGPGRSFAQLAIENMGGNKMDYYIASTLSVTGTAPTATTAGHATIKIGIGNVAPLHPPASYVFGPEDASSGDPPGLYRGLVNLYLPAGAVLQHSRLTTGGSDLFANTQDGRTAVTYTLYLVPGGFTYATLQVTLPPDPAAPGSFTVVPTPRVLPTAATVHLVNPRRTSGERQRA